MPRKASIFSPFTKEAFRGQCLSGVREGRVFRSARYFKLRRFGHRYAASREKSEDGKIYFAEGWPRRCTVAAGVSRTKQKSEDEENKASVGGKPTELEKGESGAWKRKKECEQRRWKKKRKSRQSRKKGGRKIESGMREELKYEGEKEDGEKRTEKERKRWDEGWVDSGKN